MNKPFLILCACCLLFTQRSNAQNFPDIKFSSLNTAKELPTNLITNVFKDSRGLVWISTRYNSLLRYDGKKFKSFAVINEGKGISSNYVGIVSEDKQGYLWVSTLEGLYHMNPITEEVELYQHNDDDKNSLNSNEKPVPFIDSSGNIWITSSNGLQQFNKAAKTFINYSMPAINNPAWMRSSKSVGVMMEDSRHRLWAGSPFGLYLVDTLTRSLKPYFTGKYLQVTGLAEDKQQQIWVSFWAGGLKTFNPQTGKFKDEYKPATVTFALVDWVDESNNEWLCFVEDGNFTLIDPVTKKYRNYKTATVKSTIIKENSITNICQDNENRLWICTNAGIILVDKKLQAFTNHYLGEDSDKKNNNSFGQPKALDVTAESYLVSSWYSGLLYEYDKNWHLKNVVKHVPPGSTFSHSTHTIQHDEKGIIWYGTDSGLVKHSGNTYTTYLPADSFTPIGYKYSARNILKRKDGLYWSRFVARGLYVFDAANGRFLKNYRKQYKGDALCMEYDKPGKLWLGTTDALYYYAAALDSFINFPINHPQKLKTQYYNYIYQIFFDENNTGWIGTYYGLIRFSQVTGKVDFITDPAKPHNYVVCKLLYDTTGCLWLFSSTGITRYNKNTKTYRYFTEDNGLLGNLEGYPGVFNWLNDSTIAVGSNGIITTFNPYHIASAIVGTKILFTDVVIDGKKVSFISQQKNINVWAGAKTINIHFALLNYTASQQNKLYYRLSSRESDPWIETNNGDITLLNLPPGKYILQTKGECNGDITNVSAEQISIEIQPFWYQSEYCKAFAFAALGLLIYFFIRWRVKLVKNAAALKQQIATTEMAALKAQMNPHFIFNCISSIDGLIQGNDKYNATMYLNKFAKLIRNVLDSSKENTIAFVKDMETLQLYIDLEQLRSENKYSTQLHISAELQDSDYQVPPLVIQRFVENAIHHGLRNRQDNNGELIITIERIEDHICYHITDNGIGRKASTGLSMHNHQSYGIQMSTDRIKMFNEEEHASVKIEDLYDNKNAAGTSVTVKLKIK